MNKIIVLIITDLKKKKNLDIIQPKSLGYCLSLRANGKFPALPSMLWIGPLTSYL